MSAFKQDVEVIGPVSLGRRGEANWISANKKGTKLLYVSGRTVVVRDYANPALCQLYNGHTTDVLVAKWNNSNSRIASCDKSGKIHLTEIKKSGYIELDKPLGGLGGPVYDICFNVDDKKVAFGGEAKPSARCVTLGGTDQGTISESLKRVLSVGIRPAGGKDTTTATGSYDGTVRFYKGAVPKFASSFQVTKDKKPVNAVRYSPDAKYLVAAAGKSAILVNAETGEKVSDLNLGHKGSIYDLCWSQDSTKLLSCSADTTVKLYDVGANKVLTDFDCKTSGNQKMDNFQLGATFCGDNIVSMSLNGNILYLDAGSGKITQVVESFSGTVPSIGLDKSESGAGIYSIDSKGAVHCFGKDHMGKALTQDEDKPIHNAPGVFVATSKGLVYSGTADGNMVVTDSAGKILDDVNTKKSVKGYCVQNGVGVFASENRIYVAVGDKFQDPVTLDYEVTAVALTPDNKEVIAAGAKDMLLHVLSLSDGKVTDGGKTVSENPFLTKVTSIDVSTSFIAVGTSNTYCRLLERATGNRKDKSKFCFNSSTVNCVKISPDEAHILCVGSDAAAYIYSTSNVKDRKKALNLHAGGIAYGEWKDNTTFYTTGTSDKGIKDTDVTKIAAT